jgi:hypothetical protein
MAISEHHHDDNSYPHGMLETSLAFVGSAFARPNWVSGLDWPKLGARWAAVGISVIFWIEAANLVGRMIAH